MLLQMGFPGMTELALLNLVIALVVGYFTYRDAQQRPGANAALWGIVMGLASLFLSLVGFILVFVGYYLVVVRE